MIDSPDFIYEIKWDGFRCLAFLDTLTRLQSRNCKDLTYLFPELTTLHQRINQPGCLLDGEVIALRDGKPSFLELQKRSQLRQPAAIKNARRITPVIYIIFDLLYWKGEPIYQQPWSQRREMLEGCLNGDNPFILSDFIEEKGKAYFEEITRLKMEGVIAKEKKGIYRPGKRDKTWCKFKRKILGNFIICGFTRNNTSQGLISSLILGSYFLDQLKYVGLVGTGFTSAELAIIERELQQIATPGCPFPQQELISHDSKLKINTTWIRPIVVCEVEYLERTDDGCLRHPSFKRFRPDLQPINCQYGEVE